MGRSRLGGARESAPEEGAKTRRSTTSGLSSASARDRNPLRLGLERGGERFEIVAMGEGESLGKIEFRGVAERVPREREVRERVTDVARTLRGVARLPGGARRLADEPRELEKRRPAAPGDVVRPPAAARVRSRSQ